MNLNEFLTIAAGQWPEKAALIEEDTVLTYRDLQNQITRAQEQLSALSLPVGCRVGLRYPNSIAYVVLTFALWRINAVVIPIPIECTDEEVAEIIDAIQVEAILSPKSHQESVPVGPHCFVTRHTAPPRVDNHGLNLAFIRFTSGTTSTRKGVALSHETIRDRVRSANKAFRIGSDDTVIWCLPMAHHFLITIVLYLSVGATIVLARHVVAKPFLEAINRWKGTVLYAAPFHFAMLARDTSGVQIPSVRLAVSTTCALSQDTAEDFFKRFGASLVQALGVIELGLVALNTDDPRGRWDAVGKPAGDIQVRIVDPDERGHGELAVSGPGIFDAYVAPWIPRDQVLHDGWFFTGDIARRDAEGLLFLLSRKTAVINLAGRKVFPEEIEAVINRHASVRESRVYGKPHPHLGEVVVAELVLEPPDAPIDPVRQFCREHLASYKVPMHYNVVAALPRTPVTGKIRRAAPVA